MQVALNTKIASNVGAIAKKPGKGVNQSSAIFERLLNVSKIAPESENELI